MPVSSLRLLGILAIILTIFTSPVVSLQWVTGQSIGDNNTDLADGQGANIDDGTAAEQSLVVGDGTNIGGSSGSSGIAQESPTDDGIRNDGADSGGSNASPRQEETRNGDEVYTNQEQGSLTEEEDVVLDEIQDRAAITEKAKNIRLLTEERVRQTLHGSNQLLNSTLMSTTRNGELVDGLQSIGNVDVTTHSPTESASGDLLTNASLFSQYDNDKAKLGPIHPQSEQISNETVDTLHARSSVPTQEPISSNQSATTEASSVLVNNSYNQITLSGRHNVVNESVITVNNDTSVSTLPYSSNQSELTVPTPTNASSSSPDTVFNQTSDADKTHSKLSITQGDLSTDELSSELSISPSGIVSRPISVGDGQEINLRNVSNTGAFFAPISLDKTEYTVDDIALINVTDSNANTDPDHIDTVDFIVSSGIDQIAIILTENGPNTGIFEGQFSFTIDDSSENKIKVNPDKDTFLTFSFAAAAEFTIDGVIQSGAAVVQDSSSCDANAAGFCDFDFGAFVPVGGAVELTLVDDVQLLPNEFTDLCQGLYAEPVGTCGGKITITMPHGFGSGIFTPHENVTIVQEVGGQWFNLKEFSDVSIDLNTKTLTAITPLGPGKFIVVIPLEGSPGPAPITVLNPFFPRDVILPPPITIVSERSSSEGIPNADAKQDNIRNDILPTALAASNNCDTNDPLLANYSSINCPTANNTMVESVAANTTLEIIDANKVHEGGRISLDADVINLVLGFSPGPEWNNIEIAEGTNLFWVNSNDEKQGIQVKDQSTGQEIFSDLSVPSGNFTSFKFMKPGLYEYSNLVDSNISNSGTVQVLSKGESVDNISTNSTTPTLGVLKVPIKETENFLSGMNSTGSIILSSYRIPSSSETLYVWSNNSTNVNSILSAMKEHITFPS